jgi:triacylglycerol lipase
MLSPPSQGSELVDTLGKNWFIRRWMGPAFMEMGTKPDSVVNSLPPPPLDKTMIITGNRSINWINSMIIPGSDDGKVSVKRANLPGVAAFKVVKRTHPFIMKAREVRDATTQFLKGKLATDESTL